MEYILKTDQPDERERLRYLERISDPGTHRILDGIGIVPGWACLEVGAGAGSIARWLARQVGPRGRVVATDISVDHLTRDTSENIVVLRHDICNDELPADEFNLIHSRFVMEHLPARHSAISKMISALKPGGWLVLECHDHSTAWVDSLEDEGLARIALTIEEIFRKEGADFYFGRKLPDVFISANMSEIGIDVRSSAVRFGSPESRSLELLVDHLGSIYLHRDQPFSDDDVQTLKRRVRNGPGHFLTPLVVATWGQKARL